MFLLSECYLVLVVAAAFRLAHRQAGSGMSFTAFAVAVASMMTEMLLLLLVVMVVVVVVEEEVMVVMVVVTVVAVEVVPVGGVYLLTITLEG